MILLFEGGYLPPNYLSVYLGTFVTIAFPFIPLLALPMGAVAIVDEKESGTLQYALSNPITKTEFLLGRTLGLLIATSSVVIVGFGVASVLVYNVDIRGYSGVLQAMLLAALLNLSMLGLALTISVLSRRKSTALGISILAWFLLTVVSNLGFFSVILNLRSGIWGTVPILLDPAETARLLAVIVMKQTSQLGSTGVVVNYWLGSNALAALTTSLTIWIIAPFVAAFVIFKRQDLV